MNELHIYTHYVIWALGALTLIVALAALFSHLCWKLLVAIKGWPRVFRALRAYKEEQP